MKTILLVDDDIHVRAQAASAFELEREEFTLVLAAHGAEAVRLLDERPVDMVLTDLWMPVGGFQLLAHMLNRHPRVPVGVLRTSTSQERTRGGSAAMPGLLKPLRLKSLVAEVRELLQAGAEWRHPAGSLRGFLQLLASEHKTCTLRLSHHELDGTLHVLSGEVVHAELATLVGERALFEMMGWEAPRLRLTPAVSGLRLTIETPIQKLLARERAPWPRSGLFSAGSWVGVLGPRLAPI